MDKKTFFRIEYIAEKPKSKKDKVETKEVEGGMEEMAKFIKENGLSKDGKKLTDEEVADIIEKLDKDDVVKLTDQEKELMASKEGLAEINKKFGEDEKFDIDEWEGRYKNEDEEGQIECLSCGAHNSPEDKACWYCQAELKQYNEEDISDELIQYTIYRRDGKVEHKWLTQKEYEEMWRQNDVASIKVEK